MSASLEKRKNTLEKLLAQFNNVFFTGMLNAYCVVKYSLAYP